LTQVGASTVLDCLPVAVLLITGAGDIVYRNQAAQALGQRVAAERGETIMVRLRERLKRVVLDERTFPLSQVIAVHEDGRHAEAEILVNRAGTHAFVATWRDVTVDSDKARVTQSVAEELTGAAASFTGLGESLLADAGEVSSRTSSVAVASEQMTASIAGIARSAASAATHTGAAVNAAQQAGERLDKLAASSARIGAVSQLITGIAEQTNLLALNATIEAARAGTAGRGFAVVAGEVKDLASRTASATGKIESMINDIQRDATDAEAAITEITRVIGEIERQQTTVAGAVEEQTSTAQEISSSMSAVADAASSAARAAGELRQRADFVESKSGQLRGLFAH
jgi:methyl-accepting chemotaxis protein